MTVEFRSVDVKRDIDQFVVTSKLDLVNDISAGLKIFLLKY